MLIVNALLKRIHIVRLSTTCRRSPGLVWSRTMMCTRIIKEQNPNMSFAVVGQKLILVYLQAPIFFPRDNTQQMASVRILISEDSKGIDL